MDLPEKPVGNFRTGFTTGTCAAAASVAAVLSIINQKKTESVDVLLPKRSRIKININRCEFEKNRAYCSVIKDGGDDPDVTHGAEIVVSLELTPKPNSIEIDGGEGVGRVTKPGIGLEIGQAAINPTPRKMIIENLTEVGQKILENNGIRVTISVPNGRELGPKTDNPRIGIVDGISILGTSGIVMPYSTASFAAAIRQQLDVVLSMGDNTVVLTTGGRSEDFAKEIFDLPDHSFVQFGDFSGYTISQCAKKGMSKAHVGGFIGKFAKMATGVKQTHVKGSKVDMAFLSELAKKCNASEDVIQKIKNANTARNVQEIILENSVSGFFSLICSEVYEQMRNHSENKIPIEIILFNFDGNVLARYPEQ
jgi:cobalt-precorrin-5B (C1)-methyltransferase